MPKKPVTDPHKAWNIAHHKRLEAYNKRIEALLNRAITQAADLAMRHGAKATADTPFSYSQDRQLKAETEQLLKDLSDEITKVTKQAETKEWEQAYKQSIDYLSSVYNVAKQTEAMQALFDERLVGMKARNLDAFRAFQERKIGGLRLSDKVWDYTKDFERQMEVSIDQALLEGKSAEALSRDIRSLLKDPDALFRRVRDDNDQLRMSKAMAAYHPDKGSYRSAYKNAMRLAVNEINMAYRSSDYQTAQDFDACVGIRVNLSNNHTCNGKPFVDICDELQGDYPKYFKFVGWHVRCRCFITYILKTDEEFWRDLENGENNESVNTVHDVPNQFKEWVGKNEERIAKAEERGTLPYFLRDNNEYWRTNTNNSFATSMSSTMSVPLTPTPVKDISNIQGAIADIAVSNPQYFTKGFNGIVAVSQEQCYMSTENGIIKINFATDDNGFNAGNSIVSAFDKLSKGQPLSHDEEYSIEALWHEILHNKSSNKAILPPIDSPEGFVRTVAETINQLDARHTYDTLLKQFGGTAQNKEWILKNGYGYNSTVSNLRLLLESAGIDEMEFVKEADKILMKDYTDIDIKISQLLSKMNQNKTLDIVGSFHMIEIVDFYRFI